MLDVTVHTLVKNEDQWIWYALNSVLPYVKQVFVYDTGSTDKTIERIKSIGSGKIVLELKGKQNAKGLIKLRQEMLDKTKTEWFLILDGDEIWSEKNLKKLFKEAETAPKDIVAIFNKVRNLVGDVYNYLPESAGEYEIANKKGNLNIRLIRKTKNMVLEGEYPDEAFTIDGIPIQSMNERLRFSDSWLLHTTFLSRSSIDKKKTSGSFGKKKLWQKGIQLKENELPEVFKGKVLFDTYNQFKKRGLFYEILAVIVDKLRIVKRFIKNG